MPTSTNIKTACLLTVLIFLMGCKSLVIVNSDIRQDSVLQVELSPYSSVQQRDPSVQDPSLALGVAISGGGSRAQYFGLGVLMGLEEIKAQADPSGKRNLLEEVDYFSTVSGGGFAAGYYLTARKNQLIRSDQSLHDYWISKAHVQNYQEQISYNAKIGSFIGSSFKKYERSHKRPSFPDRIDRQLLQTTKTLPGSQKKIESLQLGDFFKTGGSIPTLPMLVANGTIYNNAERLPFMPHIIGKLEITASRMPKEQLGSNSGKYNNGYTLPLKYAIAASSAFPGLIPQVKFVVQPAEGSGRVLRDYHKDRKTKYIRVIDGGVVDNLGYQTLIELLHKDRQVTNDRKRAIIIDCSGVGIEERFAEDTLGKVDILTHSLFYTLQSKYKTFEDDIEKLMGEYKIPKSNYLRLGITSLRETAQKFVDTINHVQSTQQIKLSIYNQQVKDANLEVAVKESVTLTDMNILDSLRHTANKRLTAKEQNQRWDKFYKKFEDMVNDRIKKYHLALKPLEEGVKVNVIDRIKSSDFGKFGTDDKALLVLLYELSSLVQTNVKIRSDRERSILILAGRYTVYLNHRAISKLYNR